MKVYVVTVDEFDGRMNHGFVKAVFSTEEEATKYAKNKKWRDDYTKTNICVQEFEVDSKLKLKAER